MITLTRPIRSTDDYELIGYLSISLNQQVIEEYLNTSDLEWNGSVFILKDGKVLAENQKDATKSINPSILGTFINKKPSNGSFTYEISKEKVTIFLKKISKVGWDLVEIIPFQEYSSQNRYFLWLTVYSVILAGVLVTGLVIFLFQKFLDL